MGESAFCFGGMKMVEVGRLALSPKLLNGLLSLSPNIRVFQIMVFFFFEELNFGGLWLGNERAKVLQQSKRRMELHTAIMSLLPIWSGHNVHTWLKRQLSRESDESLGGVLLEALVAVRIYGFELSCGPLEWFPRILHSYLYLVDEGLCFGSLSFDILTVQFAGSALCWLILCFYVGVCVGCCYELRNHLQEAKKEEGKYNKIWMGMGGVWIIS